MRDPKNQETTHQKMWEYVSCNLAESFKIGAGYKVDYPESLYQEGLHDCGFCVLKMLECYNGRTLIGYKMKEMFAYRRLLAYRLMYHCWNEFNPTAPNDMERNGLDS